MPEEHIDPSADLHVVTLSFEAPTVLTSGAVVVPVEDFAVLYRMSTGIYGSRGRGFRRFDRPFPYSRPYLRTLHFGSPYFFETVIPTVLLVKAFGGFPRLLDLVQQIILVPGETRRRLKENKVGRLEAERKIIALEARLDEPDEEGELAQAEQRAEISEAQARDVKARAEIAEALQRLDPATRRAVIDSYGDRGLRVLVEVAQRAESGPTVPEALRIEPVDDPSRYPEPPPELRA